MFGVVPWERKNGKNGKNGIDGKSPACFRLFRLFRLFRNLDYLFILSASTTTFVVISLPATESVTR